MSIGPKLQCGISIFRQIIIHKDMVLHQFEQGRHRNKKNQGAQVGMFSGSCIDSDSIIMDVVRLFGDANTYTRLQATIATRFARGCSASMMQFLRVRKVFYRSRGKSSKKRDNRKTKQPPSLLMATSSLFVRTIPRFLNNMKGPRDFWYIQSRKPYTKAGMLATHSSGGPPTWRVISTH